VVVVVQVATNPQTGDSPSPLASRRNTVRSHESTKHLAVFDAKS
jgi:hypothetical protein